MGRMTPIGHSQLAVQARALTCPACGHHVAVTFLKTADQPLATIAWPASAEEAQALTKLALDFVRCVECGHVYNAAFDYDAVPYTDKPNLMFNLPVLWSQHLRAVQRRLAATLPPQPTIVEIGHGDGSFLAALAQLAPGGRYVGFDPHGATAAPGSALELRTALFEPTEHLAELRPNLIISRHVLEHLSNPLGFIQEIAFVSACLNLRPSYFMEVPCIDRALEGYRTVDFYYEHNSHFTTQSFNRMLERSGGAVQFTDHGYDGEVIYGQVRLGAKVEQANHAEEAAGFLAAAQRSKATIESQMESLYRSGLRVAIWGGTGKSAAFMNRYGADATRFPTVVDSDRSKAGTFVPGTGQEIRHRDWLADHPVDCVIIPSQWRARDILAEMERSGIGAAMVLIEHMGRLLNYWEDHHPYRDAAEEPAGLPAMAG